MPPLAKYGLAVLAAVLSCSLQPLPAFGATQDTASNFPATPPVAGPAPTVHLPLPVSQTLSNGLQVVSVRRSDLPLVTARLVVRRGGEMDPVNLPGLADLTAHVLTKGAGGQSALQIATAAEALGGSLEADADWDLSAVGMTVTTPQLAKALKLIAEVVRHPDFNQADVQREEKQAADDARLRLSQPAALASLLARRSVFGAGVYGHPREGTPLSMARISRVDVQQLYRALYRPDNAVLVLAGDVTPAQSLQLAKSSFGDWAKPKVSLPEPRADKKVATLPPVLMINQRGAGQAAVVIAHRMPRRVDAGYYVATVANAVLGGSYSARLNEEIRIKRGLSYGASSEIEPLASTGLWLAVVQTRNLAAAQVVQLVLGQFYRLGDKSVSDAELAARKATLVGSYGRHLETTAGLAGELAGLVVYGINPDQLNTYIARVNAVTPKQVRGYARAHLDVADSKVVVVGDADQFASGISKLHPKAELLQAGVLDLDQPNLGSKIDVRH